MAGFVKTLTAGIMDRKTILKTLPSVEKLLEDERIALHINVLSRAGITSIVRETVEGFRKRVLEGPPEIEALDGLPSLIADEIVGRLDALATLGQRRVINATGVILHTNLGRAVLGRDTCAAIERTAGGYVDLEVDLESGNRVGRGRRVNRLLSLLAGTEDALVVNNNAAAVLLAVHTFARKGGVAVSRGELVEIGGSFRLPEILASAAGRVIEVGTTNRTHIADYERAVEEGATLLIKVHTSNYRIVGYTGEVSLKELAELGTARDIPVMYDQGSGILYPLRRDGIEGEDDLGRVLGSGIDLVCFSTDKVLGATQGGAIVGRAHLIERMRANHISRALRMDKLALAGLETVLGHLWRGEYGKVPALGMITAPVAEIASRAERLAKQLRTVELEGVTAIETVGGESSIGGGTFPINPLPTVLVSLTLGGGTPEKLAATLRGGDPAVMVRVKGDAVLLDLRSVFEEEEKILMDSLISGIGDTFVRE